MENSKNNFFDEIKRLFSNDVILTNRGNNQLKVVDINKIQTSGIVQTNSLFDKFNKIYTTTGRNNIQLNQIPTTRIQLYNDYEAMDSDAIVASALDVVADEVSLRNDFGETLEIKSSDENIQKILNNLFYDVLNVEFNLWSWTRNMCKYGDFYLKLEISENFGVYNVIPFSPYNIIRVEGENPQNPLEVKFIYDSSYSSNNHALNGFQVLGTSSTRTEFDNYEIAHFRLLTDYNFIPYGRSFIEPARKIFKQLSLVEDAMLIHRIVRAPEKRTFFINVGNIPPNEVEQYMQKTINKMKKTPHVDPQTGDYNLKYNVQNILEDFYIPVRGGDQTTRIETTKGLDYTAIDDVNYLREKLFAALKIPKAYLGFEKDLSGKSVLAAEDIRFARTVERIQRIIISELTKIGLIHLYAQGYEGESLTNFELSLTTPSIIYDQERIALLKEKTSLATDLLQNSLVPSDWIYDNIFRFSQNQYEEYRDLIIEDKKRNFIYSQIESEGNNPEESGEIYGTPSSLHSLHPVNRLNGSDYLPTGYNKGELPEPQLGRPIEKTSTYDTQDSGLGKDRLGSYQMKKDNVNGSTINHNIKKGALNLESTKQIYHQNKNLFSRKSNLFPQSTLLNENNILDEENM